MSTGREELISTQGHIARFNYLKMGGSRKTACLVAGRMSMRQHLIERYSCIAISKSQNISERAGYLLVLFVCKCYVHVHVCLRVGGMCRVYLSSSSSSIRLYLCVRLTPAQQPSARASALSRPPAPQRGPAREGAPAPRRSRSWPSSCGWQSGRCPCRRRR